MSSFRRRLTLTLRLSLPLVHCLAAGAADAQVSFDWVYVGGPGNACDTECYGAVAEVYRISRSEVTNEQYSKFLNFVAADDPAGLYNPNMATGIGGITRAGSPGSYTYNPIAGREKMPVDFVSFYDALRFANWLHNKQPFGPQGSATTEDGAYTITPGGIAANSITRNPGALFHLPSEDQWYKAAYYDPGADVYYDYPTGTDVPTSCLVPPGGTNSANCAGIVDDLTNVGSYGSTVSPSGTHDQGGNVWEWTEAASGSTRVLRGGSYNYAAGYLKSGERLLQSPSGELGSMGFRIASPIPVTPSCDDYAFLPLGDLPGGAFASAAFEATPDGSVVVGRSTSASGEEAFRWASDTGMVPLGDLSGGSFASLAYALSADGDTIVGRGTTAMGAEAFMWNAGSGMVGMGDLPGGPTYSLAEAISADGSVVAGTSESASGLESFRWTSDVGMVGIGDLPGGDYWGAAEGISPDGSTIVGTSKGSSGDQEPFRWTTGPDGTPYTLDDVLESLGDLPGGTAFGGALDVSDGGTVIVGLSSSSAGVEPFRWTEAGGIEGLGLPPGSSYGYASGISADGVRIAGSNDLPTGRQPFLWEEPGGMEALEPLLTANGVDLTGWALGDAIGISDDGCVIFGMGTNPDGYPEAWLASVPRSPAVPTAGPWWPAALLACLGFAGLRRRTLRRGCAGRSAPE